MHKLTLIITLVLFGGLTACLPQAEEAKNDAPKSASGVSKLTVKAKTDKEGLTSEQRNLKNKLDEDNILGAIKHVYILSAYSGDVLIYSTAKGKVTSSTKRLGPSSVLAANGNGGVNGYGTKGIPIVVNGQKHVTSEVTQDDGTYGSSIPYLFWWDTKGVSHKHYVSGGQIVHISDTPIVVPKVIINMETE